jgi:multicomponent Na+:H+ antiporter subunit G
MPDFYTRLSHVSKANPIGIGLMLVAMGLAFYDNTNVITRSVVAIIFLLITIPVSGHFLARVAYFIGLEKTQKMKKDELEKKFGSREEEDKGTKPS